MYVSEALARAYKLQFFLSVHLGVLPPPPHTKKLATLLQGPHCQAGRCKGRQLTSKKKGPLIKITAFSAHFTSIFGNLTVLPLSRKFPFLAKSTKEFFKEFQKFKEF